MISIPSQGIDVVVSGPGKPDKCLHVTPQKRCSDWLRLALSESGHELPEIAGVASHAKSLGYDKVAVAKAPAPAKSE